MSSVNRESDHQIDLSYLPPINFASSGQYLQHLQIAQDTLEEVKKICDGGVQRKCQQVYETLITKLTFIHNDLINLPKKLSFKRSRESSEMILRIRSVIHDLNLKILSFSSESSSASPKVEREKCEPSAAGSHSPSFSSKSSLVSSASSKVKCEEYEPFAVVDLCHSPSSSSESSSVSSASLRVKRKKCEPSAAVGSYNSTSSSSESSSSASPKPKREKCELSAAVNLSHRPKPKKGLKKKKPEKILKKKKLRLEEIFLPLEKVPKELFKPRPQPKEECLFCGRCHWSYLCTFTNTYENRLTFFFTNGFCCLCAQVHPVNTVCHDRVEQLICKWPQCGAVGDHNSALCHKISYPITNRLVAQYWSFICEGNRKYFPQELFPWKANF